MRVVHSPRHRRHDVGTQTVLGVQVPANEVAERAESILAALEADGGFEPAEPVEHGTRPITAVHDPGLLRFLETAWTEAVRQAHPHGFLAPEIVANGAATAGMSGGAREPQRIEGRAGYWALDTSTYILPGTYEAARAAVDVALTAADLVLGGQAAAYGLCRPPGHHAARSAYGGFCYFNNAAIAAEAIARQTGERVAILDLDFHHGNGTQQIFWRRADVLYVSLHADPDRQYPFFLGRAGETGEGSGAGANLNVPLPAGTTDGDYLAALEPALERIAAEPGSVLVVSLGFDTFRLDPIGDFALTTPVYHEIGGRVAALGRRLVILQEGGYHLPTLGDNARAWLRGVGGRPLAPRPAASGGDGGSGRVPSAR